MKISLSQAVAATLTLSVGRVRGDAPLQFCPPNAHGVCYSVGVPSTSATKESGNIYFQISAPTSYQWVALGTGNMMSGSNMFIMYQDGKGNVTLSPRHGTFHTPPQLDTSSSAAKLTLLEGSGVSSDGKTMTANVACSNCESWSGGGKLSLTSTDSSWISAWKSGSALDTTSKSQQLTQHDDTAIFELNLKQAVLNKDANPFVSSSKSSSGGSSGGSGSGSGSAGSGSGSAGSGSTGSAPGSGSGSSGGGVTVVSAGKPSQSILTAHAVIMSIVMVVLYPLGSMLMPLIGKWFIHAGFQTVSFLLMWAGFGLGVKSAKDRSLLFKQTHTIMGTVVVCCFLIQPALGLLHHQYYLKHQGRGLVSHAHIWYGRALLIVGIVNGGLGLQLAQASNGAIIAYSIVSAAAFLLYALVKVTVSIKKSRSAGRLNKESTSHSMPTTPSTSPAHNTESMRQYSSSSRRAVV